jgi:hypothetical protein
MNSKTQSQHSDSIHVHSLAHVIKDVATHWNQGLGSSHIVYVLGVFGDEVDGCHLEHIYISYA